MTEYEVYEIHKNQVCKELELIADKFKKTGAMTESDLDKIEKLWRTKKNMLAARGMEHPEEYDESPNEGNMSGRRMRYVSRDSGQSYAEGYSQGYNEGARQANMRQSGHYPIYPEGRYPY